MSAEVTAAGHAAERLEDSPPLSVYDDGRLRIEHDNYYVTCDGVLLRLPRKEFLILSRLAQGAGRVVRAEEIRRCAWRDGTAFHRMSLHAHIYRLRRRLRPLGVEIGTMVNVGYRLLTAGEPTATRVSEAHTKKGDRVSCG
jgi:DNA-binding response OmpR family regulator